MLTRAPTNAYIPRPYPIRTAMHRIEHGKPDGILNGISFWQSG
jgi:hypothetical protein